MSGLATATLRDPDASSHRSDQGHCATDVCPGALFQAWAAGTHTKEKGGRAKGREQGRHRGEKDGWHERGKERKENRRERGRGRTEGRAEDEESLPSEISRHTAQTRLSDEIYSVMFLSDSNQFRH